MSAWWMDSEDDMEDMEYSKEDMMDMFDDATKEDMKSMKDDMKEGMDKMEKDDRYNDWKGEDGKMKKEGKEKMMECMMKNKEDMEKKDKEMCEKMGKHMDP